MDEEEIILKLNCHECDNITCPHFKNYYIAEDSKYGCTRKVPEVLYCAYEHLMFDVLPLSKMQGFDYKKAIELLEKIYAYPIINKLDRRGKIINK